MHSAALDNTPEVTTLPPSEENTLMNRVVEAFELASLGEIRFRTPVVRKGDAVRVTADLSRRFSATDVERARGALAGHLGVAEDHLTISQAVLRVADRRYVDLTIPGPVLVGTD
jgi:hypothetical protein